MDNSMDAETVERMQAMIANLRKDAIYRVTVQEALTAFGRGLTYVEPPHYNFIEGGVGETRWLDIYREGIHKGRYTFTPKSGGTECRLNWFEGPEAERIGLIGLMDFHVKEMEVEAGQSPATGAGAAETEQRADRFAPETPQPKPDVAQPATSVTIDNWRDKLQFPALENQIGMCMWRGDTFGYPVPLAAMMTGIEGQPGNGVTVKPLSETKRVARYAVYLGESKNCEVVLTSTSPNETGVCIDNPDRWNGPGEGVIFLANAIRRACAYHERELATTPQPAKRSAAQTSQPAAGVLLDYKAGNMRRLTGGYDVGSFKIYRDFWTAVRGVEQFTEDKSQCILGELIFDLRRETEGLWLLTVQNSPESLRGQIELIPGQSPNETNINIYSAEQFGGIGQMMTWLAEELRKFAENRGLLYPPRSGTAQTTQPTKESMVRDDMQSEAGDLFLWEYLNRNKLSMILEKTPLADFTNWLEQQTSFPYGKSLRTENGQISLQRARRAYRTSNDPVWEIEAIYLHRDKDDSSNTLKSDPPLSAISFELIKLGENLKVIAACHQSVVKSYFAELLTAIAQDFPSAQTSVKEYLQETNEALLAAPNGQNKQAASRNYEFENEISQLWDGETREFDLPFGLLAERLQIQTSSKVIHIVKFSSESALLCALRAGDDEANLSLDQMGEKTHIALAVPPAKTISTEGKEAITEFVAAVILRAGLKHDAQQGTGDTARREAEGNESGNGGMSQKRKRRAETCKKLKNTHPEWSYTQVAMKAAKELGEEVTDDDVRNDYRAMGWQWERADRIR